MKGIQAYMEELAQRLREAGHGQKKPIIEDTAAKLGVSVMQVYRELKNVGWNSGRKRRRDAGTTEVPEDVAQSVAGLVLYGAKKTGKRTTTMKAATQRLEANQCMTKENGTMHSPQAISRAMKLYGCHPDMLAPKGKKASTPVMTRSLHPNHVWQLDASICVLFYLQNGNVGVMDEAKYNKNKPHNVARIAENRVWRYVVVDHCTGAFYVHYVMSAESAANALEALMAAMVKRSDNDAFYGVPRILYTDGGPGHRNALFEEVCKRLNMEHIIHETGNARATGSVEGAQNLVERGFESRMAFTSFKTLEEIQTASDLWRKHYCATVKHSRTRMSRFASWMCIKEEQLRIPVSLEALRELAMSKEQKRKVSDYLTISFASKTTGKHEYDVSKMPNIYAGISVMVRVNVFRAPCVDVTLDREGYEPVTMTVEPMQKDQFGFPVDAPVIGESFKAKEKSTAEKQREAIAKKAFATETVEEAEKAEKKGLKPFQNLDHFADVKKPLPAFMPKRGEAVGADVVAPATVPLAHVKAAQILQKRCGSAWDTDPRQRMAYIKQRYPAGVPSEALAELETIIKRGEAHVLGLVDTNIIHKVG